MIIRKREVICEKSSGGGVCYLSEAFPAARALLLGCLTYQIFAAYWPTVTIEEDEIARSTASQGRCIHHLDEVEWYGTAVIKGDLAEEGARLREQEWRLGEDSKF